MPPVAQARSGRSGLRPRSESQWRWSWPVISRSDFCRLAPEPGCAESIGGSGKTEAGPGTSRRAGGAARSSCAIASSGSRPLRSSAVSAPRPVPRRRRRHGICRPPWRAAGFSLAGTRAMCSVCGAAGTTCSGNWWTCAIVASLSSSTPSNGKSRINYPVRSKKTPRSGRRWLCPLAGGRTCG